MGVFLLLQWLEEAVTPSHKPRIHPEALVRGRCDLSAGALIRVSIRLVSLAVHRSSRNLLKLAGSSFICLPSKVVVALRFSAHDKHLTELLFCFNKWKKNYKKMRWSNLGFTWLLIMCYRNCFLLMIFTFDLFIWQYQCFHQKLVQRFLYKVPFCILVYICKTQMYHTICLLAYVSI